MIIKTVGRFKISVGDPPQHWIHIEIDGEIFQPISMNEEDARDLKYALESALRDIQKGKR